MDWLPIKSATLRTTAIYDGDAVIILIERECRSFAVSISFSSIMLKALIEGIEGNC